MNKLLEEIKTKTEMLIEEMEKNIEKGVKASGTRARNLSIELTKLYKKYRKQSIEKDRK